MKELYIPKERYQGVKDGTITRTIRLTSPLRINDSLILLNGSPGQEAEHLGEAIVVSLSKIRVAVSPPLGIDIYLGGQTVGCSNDFAKSCGFKDIDEFLKYYKDTYGLPLEAVLITWQRIDTQNARRHARINHGAAH